MLALQTGFKCPVLGVKEPRDILLLYIIAVPVKIYPPSDPILNDSQKEVVEITQGKYIVNAGPGTGKTSVVIERVKRLISRKERVAVFSFTRKSVQEIYNRLLLSGVDDNYLRLGSTSKEKKRKKNALVLISTIDSLVGHLLSVYRPDIYRKNGNINYNDSINIFLDDETPYNIPLEYEHMIIDEAQDIDNKRWKSLMKLRPPKSIVILGDPRQRVFEEKGQWFDDLWKRTQNGSIDFQRKSLNISYRFKNKYILDAQNHLSSLRPSLHVQLSSLNEIKYCSKVIVYNIRNKSDYDFQKFTEYLHDIIKSRNIRYSDIAIIALSHSKESSKISNDARRFANVLRYMGIPTSIETGEQIETTNTVIMTTIESAKGREFEVVILFQYDFLQNMQYSMNKDEILSKEYVAFTRAKDTLIMIRSYRIKGEENVLFTNCPEQYLHFENVSSTPFIKPLRLKDEKFIDRMKVTEIAQDINWETLLYYNNVSVDLKFITKTEGVININIKNNLELYGIITGFIIETYVSGSLPKILDILCSAKRVEITKDDLDGHDNYFSNLLANDIDLHLITDGKIYITKGGINTIESSEIDKVSVLLDKGKNGGFENFECDDWIFLADIVNAIFNRGNREIKYLKDNRQEYETFRKSFDKKAFESIAKFLRNFMCNTNQDVVYAEQGVIFRGIFGKIDLISNKILEIKWSDNITTSKYLYQVAIYGAMKGIRNTYIFNAKNGTLYKVTSNKSPVQWKYLLECYYFIRLEKQFLNMLTNINLSSNKEKTLQTNSQMNSKIIPENIIFKNVNGYTLNAKFDRYSKEIFEIALININDPYKSIITTFNVREGIDCLFENRILPCYSHEIAITWTKQEIERLVNESMSISEFTSLVKMKYPDISSSKVYYFSCQEGINLLESYNNKDYSDNIERFLDVDIKEKNQEKYYEKLTEYRITKPYPLSNTALGDALALSTLVKIVKSNVKLYLYLMQSSSETKNSKSESKKSEINSEPKLELKHKIIPNSSSESKPEDAILEVELYKFLDDIIANQRKKALTSEMNNIFRRFLQNIQNLLTPELLNKIQTAFPEWSWNANEEGFYSEVTLESAKQRIEKMLESLRHK
jgi:hypothetical protein